MNFLSIFDETWKQLGASVISVAEETSSCSDHEYHFWLKSDGIKNAYEALATLVALEFVAPGTRSYHKVEPLRSHIAKMCSNANSSGKWQQVKGYLLTVKPFNIRESIEYILSIMNEEDYFGNFLMSVRHKVRSIKTVKTYISVKEDRRRVTKKVVRRGYDDKGSLLPEHQKYRVYLVPREETEKIVPKEPRLFQWYDKKRYRA